MVFRSAGVGVRGGAGGDSDGPQPRLGHRMQPRRHRVAIGGGHGDLLVPPADRAAHGQHRLGSALDDQQSALWAVGDHRTPARAEVE